MDFRTISPDEVEPFLRAEMATFNGELRDDQLERFRHVLEPERTWAAFDEDGSIVGCASAFTRTMTVPGAIALPVAHVTMIGVMPTHRRRGLLTRLLGEVHAAAPEAVAALWASEAGIYGRFGYGMAARLTDLRVQTLRAALRDDAPPEAHVRLLGPDEARPLLRAVHARVRERVAGIPGREDEAWWDRTLADPEAAREGTAALRIAVLADGEGYALYAVRQSWAPDGPEHEVVVRELLASTPQAHAALWRFLLSLDLVRTVTWNAAPADEALPHLLRDPRAVRTELSDALWVALLDVPRALASRSYAAPLDLVLEVGDRGRVRLRAGADGLAACEETGDEPVDLRLGVEALGAVFLGGTTMADLFTAGRVRELRPGAVTAATRAFRGEREPWCPELF